MSTGRPGARRALLALLLLHLLTTWPLPHEAVPWTAWLQPSPDLVVLLALGYAAARRPVPGSVLPAVLALGVLLVPLYRVGVVYAPIGFGRTFDPIDHAPEALGLPHLLLNHVPEDQWVWWYAGLGAGVLVLYVLAWWSLRTLLRILAARPGLTVAGVVAVQAVIAGSWLVASARPVEAAGPWRPSSLAALARTVPDSLRLLREEERYAEDVRAARERLAGIPVDLTRLQGADVHLHFVESYGRALFRAPEAHRIWRARTRTLERALGEQGFTAFSGFLTSPVRGGGSRMAHAQLLCGVPVPSSRRFERVLSGGLEPLPRWLQRAGYLTVNAQPAMYTDWPASAAVFGFERDLFRDDFGYGGRRYPFGTMPDQFALQHLLEQVVRPSDRPVFVQFVGTSSHAPFSVVPPYYEQGPRALEPGAFAGPPAQDRGIDMLDIFGHPRARDAYLDALHYALRCSVGFTGQLRRPSLVIALGDHQPPNFGSWIAADLSREVPIHAWTNVPELVPILRSFGLHPGLDPPADAPAPSTAGFLFAFLERFSRGPAPTADREAR